MRFEPTLQPGPGVGSATKRGGDAAELMRGDSEARRANSVESPHVRIWNERVIRRLCQRAVTMADTQVRELPDHLQPLGVLGNAAETGRANALEQLATAHGVGFD